jgi:TRAP-type C4-dicarboxylate transport system permease small subunit
LKKGNKNPIVRLLDYLSQSSLTLSGIMLLIMVFCSSYGVVRRYFFNSPEPYSYELSIILLIWCFVLSIPALQMQERHLRGDFILNRLPKRAQYMINHIFAPLLGFFCALIITWRSSLQALFSLKINEVSSSAWRESVFPVKIIISIGFGILCIILIYQIYQGFANWRSQNQVKGKEIDLTKSIPGAPIKEEPDGS